MGRRRCWGWIWSGGRLGQGGAGMPQPAVASCRQLALLQRVFHGDWACKPVLTLIPKSTLATLQAFTARMQAAPPGLALLCRLALERGGTASEAVGVITSLLEEHGQGGPCEEGGDWCEGERGVGGGGRRGRGGGGWGARGS